MEARKEKDINLITDITLDLVDTLSSLPGIKDVSVSLRPGAEKAMVAAWEQRHGVPMTNNLKQLYLTSDGFSLTWNYVIGGKILPLGNLEVHPLSKLNRVGSGRCSGDLLAPSMADLAMAEDSTPATASLFQEGSSVHDGQPIGPGSFNSDLAKNKIKTFRAPSFHVSKLFEIDNCRGNGKVVVAYPGRFETFPEGSFWFIDLSLRPHLLATDFILYWRLLLVYLGLPQWQALAAGIGLTPWARWYEIIAPHILEGSSRQLRAIQPELINKLDWAAFKSKKIHKNKTHKEKESTREHGRGKENVTDNSKTMKDKEKSRFSKDTTKELAK